MNNRIKTNEPAYTTTVSMLDKKRIAPNGWKFLKIEYKTTFFKQNMSYTSVKLVSVDILNQDEDAVRAITDQMFKNLKSQYNF